MDVLTVTLNPALDRLIEIDDFKIGTIHRIFESGKTHISPGGKGVNVSLYLDQLGVESTALGILGGLTGRMFQVRMKRDFDNRIFTSFLYVKDETRENLTLVDKKSKTITTVNLPGPKVDQRSFELFMKKYEALLSRVKICEIGGTIPAGISLEVYYKMVKMAKKAGVMTIVNAHGEPLCHAVEAGPDIVKPDIRGTKEVLGKVLSTLDDYISSGRRIISMGAKMVIYSFEVKNDLVITPEWAYLFKMKGEIKRINLMGTGDAYIAGLIYGILDGKDLFESARYAMAAAIADELTEGKNIGGVEGMNAAMKLIEMERVSS